MTEVEAMRIIGEYFNDRASGFYHVLIDMWYHADSSNKAKLKTGFPVLFETWDKQHGMLPQQVHYLHECQELARTEYTKLQEEHQALKEAYSVLDNKSDNLTDQITKLYKTISSLEAKISKIQYKHKPSLKLGSKR